MRILTGKMNVLRIAVIALVAAMAMPVTSLAKHQGRGRGRDFDKFERKCGKFINCHDARDGRWDGRGPRRRFDDRFRFGRFRNRDFDDDDFRRLERRRFRNRDFDDDDFRRLERRRFRNRDFDDDDFRRLERRRFRNGDFDDDDFRRLQRRRFIIDRYQGGQYYNYNPYGYQRGFNWTDVLNLFLQ